MATVYVSLGQAGAHSTHGGMPVFRGPGRSETITSSASNAEGALTANKGDVATVRCDSALYVNVGAAASTSAGYYVAANERFEIALEPGEKVNVIDV